MDEVGFAGGPCAPAAAAAHRRRARRAARRDGGRRAYEARSGRLPHGGDADPRDHGRRRPDPGRDDARAQAALRGRDGRPAAAADARAARPLGDVGGDPAAADARRRRLWACCSSRSPGCLPMCGHGTIGVATVLVETGLVEVTEPETVVRLDTPAGLVEARVHGRRRSRDRGDAAQRPVVPATSASAARRVVLRHRVRRQLLRVRAGRRGRPGARAASTSRRGAEIMAAINEDPPVHPDDARIAGCRHVVFHAPGRDGADARNATSIHPGWLDRSPCGTGTSARMAQLHANGELAIGEPFVNESVIGTRFTGRLVGETTVGRRTRPWSRRSPAARGSPARRVPAGRRRSVPRRLRAVNAGCRGRRRRHRRRLRGVRACACGRVASRVLERGAGWGEECSWGNAGLLVPSHARPIAAPESLRAGLRWMVRRDSPFGMRPQPALVPWLLRYARASTAARAAAGRDSCSAR